MFINVSASSVALHAYATYSNFYLILSFYTEAAQHSVEDTKIWRGRGVGVGNE
jgi:hypothetical protein